MVIFLPFLMNYIVFMQVWIHLCTWTVEKQVRICFSKVIFTDYCNNPNYFIIQWAVICVLCSFFILRENEKTDESVVETEFVPGVHSLKPLPFVICHNWPRYFFLFTTLLKLECKKVKRMEMITSWEKEKLVVLLDKVRIKCCDKWATIGICIACTSCLLTIAH